MHLLTTTSRRLPIAISRPLRSINSSATTAVTATSSAARHLHSASSFAQQRSASALHGCSRTSRRPTLFSPVMASTAPTTSSSSGKYSTLATPEYCYVDFCLVPLGTGQVSVAEEVAECQKVLQESGLSYTLHSAGTTVEGPWDEVMKAVGQAHSAVLAKGVVRIQTSMRVGTRTDRKQVGPEKIKRVQDILAKDSSA